MKFAFAVILIFILSVSSQAQQLAPEKERIDIWPNIPFTRGADLCRYRDAFDKTRSEYIQQMVQYASDFMYFGATPRQSLSLLVGFNQLYERNLQLAMQQKYLDVTLESTLKAFISDYYRNLRPRTQKISFNTLNDLVTLTKSPNPTPPTNQDIFKKIEFIAHGTYSYAPNCQGDILVTLHLIGQNGDTKSYIGNGSPSVVMSQIASRIFEDFQRTQFPSRIKVGNTELMLVGGLNGSVDKASSPGLAEKACSTLEARLPTAAELDLLDAYGSWSGGISLGEKIWALAGNKVFAPLLRNPSPIREVWEVNAEEFMYYCVR